MEPTVGEQTAYDAKTSLELIMSDIISYICMPIAITCLRLYMPVTFLFYFLQPLLKTKHIFVTCHFSFDDHFSYCFLHH